MKGRGGTSVGNICDTPVFSGIREGGRRPMQPYTTQASTRMDLSAFAVCGCSQVIVARLRSTAREILCNPSDSAHNTSKVARCVDNPTFNDLWRCGALRTFGSSTLRAAIPNKAPKRAFNPSEGPDRPSTTGSRKLGFVKFQRKRHDCHIRALSPCC